MYSRIYRRRRLVFVGRSGLEPSNEQSSVELDTQELEMLSLISAVGFSNIFIVTLPQMGLHPQLAGKTT